MVDFESKKKTERPSGRRLCGKGEVGASGPSGPTGTSPPLTKHEMHRAWTGEHVYVVLGL